MTDTHGRASSHGRSERPLAKPGMQELAGGVPPAVALHLHNLTPALDYAFPSVGIEYAKSAGEMARTYFEAFHKRNGHAS